MYFGALLLSLILSALASAAPTPLVPPAFLRRHSGGPPLFSLGLGAPVELPLISISNNGNRGPHCRGPHSCARLMGRYYAIRWGPKNRAIVRSLAALHALLQDLEGDSSSSSSSSNIEGPLPAFWQVAACPSLEDAEAWLDQQSADCLVPDAKRRTAAEGNSGVYIHPKGGEGVTSNEVDVEIVTAFADGACPSNGRAEARAGIGVYFGGDDPRNVSLPLGPGPQTNQRAELAAILAALISFSHADDAAAAAAAAAAGGLGAKGERTLKRERNEGQTKEQELHLYCDSNYAVQCVGPWADRWEANGWRTTGGTSVSNADIIKAVRLLLRERRERAPLGARWRGRVRFLLVKGHSGITGNDQADALAVRGAQMQGVIKGQIKETPAEQAVATTFAQYVMKAQQQ